MSDWRWYWIVAYGAGILALFVIGVWAYATTDWDEVNRDWRRRR